MVKRSIGVLLLVLASVCTVTAQSTSALRINEVLTNNVSNYVDPFGNRGAGLRFIILLPGQCRWRVVILLMIRVTRKNT